MRILFAAIMITLLQTGFAAAESFTFTVTFEPAAQKTVTVGKRSASLMSNKGKYSQKWASGVVTTGNVTCTVWSTGEEDGFDSRGICETVDSDGGTAGYLYTCNFLNDAKTETVCWGEQSGKGGKFDGRTGSITWGQEDNKASGGGLWKG